MKTTHIDDLTDSHLPDETKDMNLSIRIGAKHFKWLQELSCLDALTYMGLADSHRTPEEVAGLVVRMLFAAWHDGPENKDLLLRMLAAKSQEEGITIEVVERTMRELADNGIVSEVSPADPGGEKIYELTDVGRELAPGRQRDTDRLKIIE